MSDEQQPHRPEPGSGWQPMPHGPEYDAEATAFVQLPPDYAHPDPTDPSGHWDPLAAPGTGYTPPPMTGPHGAPSQGGQWQPAAHDPATAGHWSVPGADTDGSGYGYGGHPEQHGSGQWPEPAEGHQGHQGHQADQGTQAHQTSQTHQSHPPHTGHWPVPPAEEPVDDWPVPAPSDDGTGGPVHTSQWTIPVAGDEGVDETGEYRVDDHPGPAAPPYGGPAGHGGGRPDPQTTAQWRMPYGDAAPERPHQPEQPHQPAQPHQPEQPGHTGQWSVPAADEGPEDSGEYAVEAHPGPAATPSAPHRAAARRPLRMPDAEDPAPASGPDPAWHGPAGGDSGEFAVEGQHAGLRTPPHGSPAAGLPQGADWRGEFPGDAAGPASHTDPEDGAGRTAEDAPPSEDAGRDEETHDPAAGTAGDAGHERATAEDEFPQAVEAPETASPDPTPDEAPPDAPEAADAPAEPLPAPAEDAPADPGADTAPLDPSLSEHPQASYVLHVNGADRPVTDSWIGESLLYVLRERLGLAGAKDGCSQGECGACSVQVDGRLVASCLVPAATAAGSEVRTVEGLAVDGQPSDVQRALAECGAVQCGFCVPGLAMTVHDLLEGNHAPTDQETRQAICGNLCRCSGYRGVVEAVREVVAAREAAEEAEAAEDGAAPQDPARIPHQAGPPGAHGSTGHGSVNGSGSGRASA